MQELISFFIQLGMNPEQAARQAQDMISHPHSFSTPGAAAARGQMEHVYDSSPDALVELLQSKYGLDPDTAASYAKDVVAGKAQHGDALKAEALSNVAKDTADRLHAIGRYSGAAQRVASGQNVNNEDLQYLRVGHNAAKEDIKAEADRLRQEKLSALAGGAIQGIQGTAPLAKYYGAGGTGTP